MNSMKRLCQKGAAGIVIAWCTATAQAGVVLIENQSGKTPVVTHQTGVTLDLVKEIDGKPNDRFFYGMLGKIDSAVNVRYGRVEPYGKIALHEGNSNYVLYVTKGTGVLVNVDTNGKESSRFEFRAGDVITFKPYTMHHWEAGPEGYEFLGVEQREAQPR